MQLIILQDEITKNIAKLHTIFSKYFANLYANKLEISGETVRLLGTHELIKLNQEDTKNNLKVILSPKCK